MVTDPLNLLYKPELDDEGFPCIQRRDGVPIPTALYEYTMKKWPETGAAQFFSRSSVLETVWNQAARYGKLFMGRYVISPLFPIRHSWPEPVQRWNVYRSRWLAAYWQMLGAKVIPSVNWGGMDGMSYVFRGLPHRSMLAIECIETRGNEALFRWAVDRLFEVFDPPCILCYGNFAQRYGGQHDKVIAYLKRGSQRDPGNIPVGVVYQYC